MDSIHLHQQLEKEFAHIGLKLSKPQRKNLALLRQALAVSSNCHLNTLVLAMPVPGQRENIVQRTRRMLSQTPKWEDWYGPIVKHLFSHWTGVEVSLVMDRTDLANRRSILTLGVAHGKRLLPLCWKVLPFGGTSGETQIELLQQVQPYLPLAQSVPITFYGDGKFRAVDLQAYCRQQGWHWQVGLKSDIRFQDATGNSYALRELPVMRGQILYRQNVTLTEKTCLWPGQLAGALGAK